MNDLKYREVNATNTDLLQFDGEYWVNVPIYTIRASILNAIENSYFKNNTNNPNWELTEDQIEQVVEIILNNNELKNLFLSKIHEDVALEIITFLKGIVAYGVSNFDSVNLENLIANKVASFKQGATFGNSITGLLGTGASINENGHGEFDSLFVRKFLEVPELRYNRVNIYTGIRWDTFGAGLIENVIIDKDSNGNELDTGTIILHLENGEYGAVSEDDLCQGIFHNFSGMNDNINEDQRNGNFRFMGFNTVYFRITQILDPNFNSIFRYQLRPISDNWNQQNHPQPFMNFAAYANMYNTDRQACSYSTTEYTIRLDNMNDWEYDESNIYGISGKLEGFKMGETIFNGYGNVFGNAYIYGTIQGIEEIVRDNIQVGGKNLLREHALQFAGKYWGGGSEWIDVDNIRTFVISESQQYIQNINLRSGRYTISFSINTPNISHKFAFKNNSNDWIEFEINNLTPDVWLRKDKGKLTFYLEEDIVAFNLCTSSVSEENPVLIQELMLEEGINASTAKPNELDLLESVEDSYGLENIFKQTLTFVAPPTPISIQQDNYIPDEWDDDPITATPTLPFVWKSFRERIGGAWGPFSNPTIFSNYAKDGDPGETAKSIEIRGNTSLKNPGKIGGVSSTTLSVIKHGFNTSIKWEYMYQGSWQVTPWITNTLTIDYTTQSSLFVNDVLILRCISDVDPTVFTVVSITAIWDGDGGLGVILTNQSHNFPGSSTAALPSSTQTKIISYKGGQIVIPTMISVDISNLPTGMTYSGAGTTLTFTVTSQMTSPSGEIPIYVEVDGKSFTLYFSYTISFRGADGITKDIRLDATTQIIRKLKNGTWNPSDSVIVRGQAVNTTITEWTYSVNGGTFTINLPNGVTRSGNLVFIEPSAAIAYDLYSIRASDGNILDTISIMRIEDGINGEDGDDGVSIVTTTISYQLSTNGNTAPTGTWLSSVPAAEQGKYLWTRTTITYSDGRTPTVSYSVSYHGTNGTNGLNGSVTEWGYLLNNIASTPTKPTGNLPNGGWTSTMGSITVSNQYLWISSRTKPAGSSTFGAWSNATLYARWPKDGEDGLPGIPGQVPVQKEWETGDRHRNSDEIIDFIYVRGTDAETSYWYQLVNKTDTVGILAGAAPIGGAVPSGYKTVSWLKTLAVKTLIAEEANLANFIFKDGKLISIKGATYAGEEIDYGEYTEYNFANTVSQPAVGSASWTPFPVGTLTWVRYKKNTDTGWTVKQIGTISGRWVLEFSPDPEGTWYTNYSTNYFWMRIFEAPKTTNSIPYRPVKFTTSGGFDFIPHVILDGNNGTISGLKVIASNVKTNLKPVFSGNTTDVQDLLNKGYSVDLSGAGSSLVYPTDYSWYPITLPGNKELSGSLITIHAPGSIKRYRIKPFHSNGVFWLNEPKKVLKELQVVPEAITSIELKALWDNSLNQLDWHVLSKINYMMNYTHPTIPRVPLYFSPGDILYRGKVIASSSSFNTSKEYQSIITQVFVEKSSSGINRIIITVPMPSYFSSGGSTLNRNYSVGATYMNIRPTGTGSSKSYKITSNYTSSYTWVFEVTMYDSNGAVVYDNFEFEIYANDYIVQSPRMDNKLEDN